MTKGALAPRARRRPYALIDIGSNSIRLVVYDLAGRMPVPLFNEKILCALGESLGTTGRLHLPGIPMALAALGRFAELAKRMKAVRVDALATAAVRDAQDGPEFVDRVRRELGLKLRVLSGTEEAKLAAQGVLCARPKATGLVADLGGGSLDLMALAKGRFGSSASLPLGVLRLIGQAGEDRDQAQDLINESLATLDWLPQSKGQPLYAIGGSWRSLARIFIAQTGYPLQVIDQFSLRRSQAEALCDLVSRQSRRSLEKFGAVSRKRISALPVAALVLLRLLQKAKPDQLIFSVHGVREGQFFQRLGPAKRREDALLSAARDLARARGRFPEHADEVALWIDPLFPVDDVRAKRLRQAAVLLSDLFWHEHPDYRAEQAYLGVLRLPFMGLDHDERIFLALVQHFRYQGTAEAPLIQRILALMPEERRQEAEALGLALRLGHVISGGAPKILATSRLGRVDGMLALTAPPDHDAFTPDAVEKPLERLAKALGIKTSVLLYS
ncbi:MAG: Ppx/GppA family phosphatase [Rhodospirillales bacterium]|nr:Ppx/GppA family phosphatase [Rhodospirillales bacterium]